MRRLVQHWKERHVASMFETCKHKKQAPKDLLNSLPDGQAGTGRHKCVVCAYETGIEEGLRRAAIQQKESQNS